jgi:hypothetical protein
MRIATAMTAAATPKAATTIQPWSSRKLGATILSSAHRAAPLKGSWSHHAIEQDHARSSKPRHTEF